MRRFTRTLRSPLSESGSRRRATALLLAPVVASTTALALASPASAAVVGSVANVNGPGTAFPTSYSAGGTTLVPCLTPAHCGGAAAEDITAPDGEFFYNLVEGTAGNFRVVIGLEGAFLEDGTPVVFNRIRFRANNMTPGATYTIKHPYGVTTVTADGRGRARSDKFRPDEGCEPAAGATCNFAEAMAPGSAYSSFLTSLRDTGLDGFKDNDGRAGPITSGPAGRDYVEVFQGTKSIAKQTNFTVQAQLAP
jgi:hypothetical protein